MSTVAIVAPVLVAWLVLVGLAIALVRSARVSEPPPRERRSGTDRRRNGARAALVPEEVDADVAGAERRGVARPWTGPAEDALLTELRHAQEGVQSAEAGLFGARKRRDRLVRRALESGVDLERVAEITGLSRTDVERLVA